MKQLKRSLQSILKGLKALTDRRRDQDQGFEDVNGENRKTGEAVGQV